MRRKKQFLLAALCAFSMSSNIAAIHAQGLHEKREPRSNARQAPERQALDFATDNVAIDLAVAGAVQDVAIAAPQVEFIHHEFSFDGRVVKGAPYSAEIVAETIQTLGDGNRIIRNSSSKFYRDSAGRTRREQEMKAIGPWTVSGETRVMITINDPVAGVHYSLDPSTKTAHKMTAPRMVFRGGEANASAELKAKMKDKLKMKAANDAESGAVINGVVTNVITDTTNGVVSRTVSGAVTNAVSGAVGPVVSATTEDAFVYWSDDAEANRESLGKQMIEGVEAEGTRVTLTIPAGKIGNERPIVTVNERWYSPELQTIIFSKNSDPRMGETTYRLTNISRGEPDPALFQVPADYVVKEGGFSFGFVSDTSPEPPKGFIERRRRPNDN